MNKRNEKKNFLKNDVNLLKTSFIKENFWTSFSLTFLNVTSSSKSSF